MLNDGQVGGGTWAPGHSLLHLLQYTSQRGSVTWASRPLTRPQPWRFSLEKTGVGEQACLRALGAVTSCSLIFVNHCCLHCVF